MSETGLEKHRRIKREQKARFLKKQKEKQATGGLDDGQVKTKFISKATKSKASKLGSGAYSSGSRNPTNFTVKTNKLTKNEATKSDNTKTKDTKNISFKEAQSKGALKNTAFNLVPDAFQISNYIKDRLKSNKKTTKVEDKKTTKVADKKPQPPTMSQSVKDKRAKTSASASNTKNFASTMAMQKKLIAKGAKIKADGIMGPKTRAAMAKYMKAPVPKSRPKGTLTSKFGGKKITAKQRLKEINDEKAKSYFSNLASSLKKKSKAKG